MNWIWVGSIVLWVLILGLSLVMLALMRRVGELANYIDRVSAPGSNLGEEDSDQANLEAARAEPEPEPVEAFAPFTKLPEHSLPLFKGGAFRCGRGQAAPQLLVFFSPKSRGCEQLPQAMHDFVKNNSPSELLFLAILDLERSAAAKYIADNRLESIPLVLLEDIPTTLRPGETPFAIAISIEGKIAARGKPKTLPHLTEMAVAARHMASMCPDHSRRAHEWGESAPYWTPGQISGGNMQALPVVAEPPSP